MEDDAGPFVAEIFSDYSDGKIKGNPNLGVLLGPKVFFALQYLRSHFFDWALAQT